MTFLFLVCSVAFLIVFISVIVTIIRDTINKKSLENHWKQVMKQSLVQSHRTIILPNSGDVAKFDHVKLMRQKPLSMKEAIEKALPSTPIGCMWSVKRVKVEWWEGWMEVPLPYKTTFDASKIDQIGSKREWVRRTPKDKIWEDLPSKGKQRKDNLEIEFITPDSSSKILLSIDNNMSRQDIIDCLVSEIEHQCPALVNEYINSTDDWDGVYIKNGE